MNSVDMYVGWPAHAKGQGSVVLERQGPRMRKQGGLRPSSPPAVRFNLALIYFIPASLTDTLRLLTPRVGDVCISPFCVNWTCKKSSYSAQVRPQGCD